MNLQTKLKLSKQVHHPISYDSKLLLVGSCFSKNIGDKLDYFKFDALQNPFGILFHPKAIENFIFSSVNQRVFKDVDLFFLNERWHSFEVHSALSNASKENILNDLNTAIQSTYEKLQEASHLIITLGTAWVYRHIESDSIVANCHKVPQKKFLKELLEIDKITESLESMMALIRAINPKVNFIFTVSPVRHLKDGFTENQVSKSHLISAIHQVVNPRNQVYYFPSYEIMMDELRDYRFYKEDMVHPNATAIDYIWEKFSETWISESSSKTMKKVASIQKRLQHKPFHPNSEEHQKFLEILNADIEAINQELSYHKF